MALANYFLRLLLAGVATAVGMTAQVDSGAFAADGRDCDAVNEGYMTVELSPTASTVRRVKLAKGDVVTFQIGGAGGGSVTLPSGARLLLAGPRGARKSFTASRSGDFSFRLAAEGAGAVAFTASCTPSAVRGARIADMNDLATLLQEDIAGPLIDPEPLGSATALAAPGEATASRRARQETGSAQALEASPNGSAPQGTRPGAEAGPVTAGLKVQLQPAIMVGVLAQFDPGAATLLGPSDRSWLAGPVTSLRLGAGTSLEARAAWGQTEPDWATKPHGADRRLVDARLTNRQELGAWRFSPSVGLNYAQDRTEAGPAVPNAIGLQTSEAGRLDVRPELAYRFDMDHAMFIEPKVMVGPFWDIADRYAPAPGMAAHIDARLKAETGVTIGTTDGTKLQIGGGVEEGGPNSLNVWSGRLRVDVPLK